MHVVLLISMPQGLERQYAALQANMQLLLLRTTELDRSGGAVGAHRRHSSQPML